MERRSRTIPIILLFLLSGVGAIAIYLQVYSNNLEYEILKRDSLIINKQIQDSLYNFETKKYSEVINRYISNCNFTVNGKNISTSELVRMVNQTSNENGLLTDSINALNSMIEVIEDEYGIKLTPLPVKNGLQAYTRNQSRADSGLLLLPYYGERLKFDTVSKSWKISIQKKIVK